MINLEHIKMRKVVEEELRHLPRGDENQNLLRAFYQQIRMHSLGKKATVPNDKNKVLEIAMDMMKKNFPNFAPDYDKQFFKLAKG